MLSLFLPQLRLDAQAIKLQYNSGSSPQPMLRIPIAVIKAVICHDALILCRAFCITLCSISKDSTAVQFIYICRNILASLGKPASRVDRNTSRCQPVGQGGCFPIHLDSDETVDSRRVTAIVYLNRNWRKGHGGELRLYPSWTQHVDIAPVNDRLVVFSSCRMPHR